MITTSRRPKPEEIFKPGSFPKYTYISRKSMPYGISYELRLEQALKISGCLTSIVGPSKIGKTILCEKVIGTDKVVEVSGGDFNDDANFWEIVAAKAGLPYKGEFTSGKDEDGNSQIETFSLTKDRVIDSFKERGLVLILDDFHYAPQRAQVKIAQQLKDAIRHEFKAIVISLPHRSDDAIRKNADLSGRLSLINMQSWSNEELSRIAIKGFKELGLQISNENAYNIAMESLTSPQLTQYICLSACTLLENAKEELSNSLPLKQAYQFTTANLDYGDVVKTLTEGPNPRGRRRKLYCTRDGKQLDVYALLIESLAKNPPRVSLSFASICERIVALIAENETPPNKQSIRKTLHGLQETINMREEAIYKALEWKDDAVHILDPLFLFFLRWGRS